MSTLQEIEAAVLRLPDKDRLQLADKILGSLPRPPVPAEADEILAEAIRRDAELESGKATPLSETEFWRGTRPSRG
jgi:putative addiction module component (TIGR02574 family)